MSDDLITFVRARLDEDELWATEASRRWDGATVAGGTHWQWEDAHDEVRTPAPDVEAYIGDGAVVSLRSQETWPTSVGDLPQFAISHAEEVPTAVGGHIALHDPAWVLSDLAAKRGLVDECERTLRFEDHGHWLAEFTLRQLALPYDEHTDYRPGWAPVT